MAINAIILDSGAFTALGNNNEAIRVALKKAAKAGVNVYVPTVVIAESVTGTNRDAGMHQFSKRILRSDCTETIARVAGKLRYVAGASLSDTIDAIVVATADRYPGSWVITGDSKDLKRLSQVQHVSRVIDLNAVAK